MKGKAITAALIGAAVALGDSVRDAVTPGKEREDRGRKRWHSHRTRMSRGRGIRLNMLQLRNLPATPAKINWRRSDPHHDQHHRYCGLAQPCTDKQGMEERVARHEASA
jgi:hypothetical protein